MKNGNLEIVIGAVGEISQILVPYELTKKIVAWRKFLVAGVDARKEVFTAIFGKYSPDDRPITPEDETYKAVTEEVDALYSEEVQGVRPAQITEKELCQYEIKGEVLDVLLTFGVVAEE